MSVVVESLRKIAKEIERLSPQTIAFVMPEPQAAITAMTSDPDLILLCRGQQIRGAFKNIKDTNSLFQIPIRPLNHMQATAVLSKLREIKKHD